MFDDWDPSATLEGPPQRLDKIDRQDSAKDRGEGRSVIRIDYDLCDDTGACASVCPEDVIEYHNGHAHVVKGHACTECWICVENCPSGAIDIS